MKTVHLGIIGCGVVGQKLLEGASGDSTIRIAAVADLREHAARETAARFKADAAYTDADALLADSRVEGVVLAMPTTGRAEIALRALARGKHVLIEKPVAMNAAEARRILGAQGDLLVGCCSGRFRTLEHATIVTRLIESGALGELRMLQSRVVYPADERPVVPAPAWRFKKSLNGGGILVDAGCYDLDYLLGLCGWKLKPKLVLAQTWRTPPLFETHIAPGSDAEAHVVAMIRCENGAVIQLERGESTTLPHEEAWRIIGTHGSLRLQMTPVDDHKIFFDEGDAAKGVVSHVLWQGKVDWMSGHRGIIRDFAAAIREGRPPRTNIEQALVVQQVCDAIYESAKQGNAVNVS